MLCKNQDDLEKPCEDGTSRAVRCKLGFENACMKHCNELCAGYERVVVPKPPRGSAWSVTGKEERGERERVMRGKEGEGKGGCCGR